MSVFGYLLINFFSFILFGIINRIAKKKKPFKRAFLQMLFGVFTLTFTDIIGLFTGVYLPVSMLSITISACLSVPGVAAMMVVSWVL